MRLRGQAPPSLRTAAAAAAAGAGDPHTPAGHAAGAPRGGGGAEVRAELRARGLADRARRGQRRAMESG